MLLSKTQALTIEDLTFGVAGIEVLEMWTHSAEEIRPSLLPCLQESQEIQNPMKDARMLVPKLV
jgi:hypothetical protein